MIKPVTAQEMKDIDRKAYEEYGIPSILLMENAGRSVADTAESIIKTNDNFTEVTIFCGSGNNGGDGLVAARHLTNRGYIVKIIMLNPYKEFKGDALINYNIAEKMSIPVLTFGTTALKTNSLIIDALLGTGTKGEVKDIYKKPIDLINTSKQYTISVDIPSGLCADTGKILGTIVKANTTVTMGLAKKGLLNPEAKDYVGNLVIADIGLPHQLLKK